ncbi:hypothetical protein L0U85_06965 [Glycomyces sp. L485]|uniref:hypothetical protein n=1 Tax=Glycomyces sp. L485 TaxID=2909235 RepID=UPI001F4B8E48|nr:hypothetical protein [Glycomyces sp. L485]MCH7230595.1 hypothetical protein [Glycomyces sp. L485]
MTLAKSPPTTTTGADRSRQLTVLALAVLALAMLLPVGFWPSDVRDQLVFRALSVTLLAFAALRLITLLPGNEHGIGRWRLGPWYLLWTGLAFGLASLTWLGPQTGSATRIALPSVVTGLGVLGLAVVAWTVGYLLGPPRGLRNAAGKGLSLLLRGTGATVRGGLLPWVFYAVATGARIVAVLLTGRFGYVGDPSELVSTAQPYNQLLHLLSTFALFAIAAASYRAFNPAIGGSKIALWTLVVTEAFVGSVAGSKSTLLLALAAVLIPYGALRRRLPLRLLLIGAVLFLWIAVPFNTAYRDVVRGDDANLTPSEAVAAAPQVLTDTVTAQSPVDTVSDSADAMLRRIREIDSIAIITQMTPDPIAYRSPWEFALAPTVGLVPRAIWPEKPIYANGYEFSQEYYGIPSTTYTSTAITGLGDLYRHGGLWTVAVGMVVIGAGCRLFDLLFQPESDPRALCFVVGLLPVVVKSEIDISLLLTGIPGGVAVAVVGARLMCRPDPNPTEERP